MIQLYNGECTPNVDQVQDHGRWQKNFLQGERAKRPKNSKKHRKIALFSLASSRGANGKKDGKNS